MFFKTVLIVCAQAVLIQSVFSQCLGPSIGRGAYGLAGPALAGPVTLGAYGACGTGVSSTGGGFPVTSASPFPPTGVSVISENTIEGSLSAVGNLPLLGAVSLEGAFPTAGSGAVSYGCGSGAIGIRSEGPIATGILAPGPALSASPLGYPGLNGLGYNGLGIGSCGCAGALY